jgi:drug/metabolite transporter (DMT)-like permease
MIQPIGSLAAGAAIFAESPSPLQLLGAAAVLGALVTATVPARRRRVQPLR